MKKRAAVWSALVLGIGLTSVLAVPVTRYRILAYLRNEPLIDGRPLDYWVAALKNDDAGVRRQAALNLGETTVCKERSKDAKDDPCEHVVGALVQTLGDSDGFVRKCGAVSFLLTPRTVSVPAAAVKLPALGEALKDPEVVVRKAAARAFWQVAPPPSEAVARLADALVDSDDFVRAYATRALARIGPDAGAAVPALLLRLQKDDEVDIRKLAGKALGLIGAPAIAAQLPATVKASKLGSQANPPNFANTQPGRWAN